MNIEAVARLIPDEYRREILELNMIDSAVAIMGNESMNYLGVIWKQYIEPDFTPDCSLCYARVLNGFKAMKEKLIEMEKGSKLLDDI